MSVISLSFLGLAGISSIAVWAFGGKLRPVLIAVFNLCFLAMFSRQLDWIYAAALIAVTWAGAMAIRHFRTRSAMILSILIPIIGLLCFKYLNAFTPSHLIAPIGLSFYTFKAISYLVDFCEGKTACTDLLYVFDYLAFFPAFMAGPISRCESFFEELQKPFRFDYRDQKNGAFQAACGVFEKMVIADELSYVSGAFLKSGQTGWYLSLGMILYSFYIYSDFDAYSNIAIGIARMLGFHLEPNFHCPYLAENLREFWHRWHISLSTWLRDYIYIPLGGNRHGTLQRYLNILAVFLVSGIWHGNTIMFALWGLGHGVFMVLEDLLERKAFRRPLPSWLKPLRIALNFLIVCALWTLFRSPDPGTAAEILQSAVHPCAVSFAAVGLTVNEAAWTVILVLLLLATDLLRNRLDLLEAVAAQKAAVRWLLYAAMIILVIVFGSYGIAYDPADFVYVTF